MRASAPPRLTRVGFSRLLRYMCVTAAILLPAIGALSVSLNHVIEPQALKAQEEYEQALTTRTEARVQGIDGLCGETATKCSSLGMALSLPGGDQTVVKWASGKPYGNKVVVWQKTNGKWTTNEPQPAGGQAWGELTLVAVAALAAAAAGVIIFVSIPRRTWHKMAPAFLDKTAHETIRNRDSAWESST